MKWIVHGKPFKNCEKKDREQLSSSKSAEIHAKTSLVEAEEKKANAQTKICGSIGKI